MKCDVCEREFLQPDSAGSGFTPCPMCGKGHLVDTGYVEPAKAMGRMGGLARARNLSKRALSAIGKKGAAGRAKAEARKKRARRKSRS